MLTIENVRGLIAQIDEVMKMKTRLHLVYVKKIRTAEGCQEVSNRLIGYVEENRKKFAELLSDGKATKAQKSNFTGAYLLRIADLAHLTVMMSEDGLVTVEEILTYLEKIMGEIRMLISMYLENTNLQGEELKEMTVKTRNYVLGVMNDACTRIGYTINMNKIYEVCVNGDATVKALVANKEEANKIAAAIKQVYETQDTKNIEVRKNLRNLLFEACKINISFMAIAIAGYDQKFFRDMEIIQYAENKCDSTITMAQNFVTFDDAIREHEYKERQAKKREEEAQRKAQEEAQRKAQEEAARIEAQRKAQEEAMKNLSNSSEVIITAIEDAKDINCNAEISVNSNMKGNDNMNNQPVAQQQPVAPVAQPQVQATPAQNQNVGGNNMGNLAEGLKTDANGNFVLTPEALNALLQAVNKTVPEQPVQTPAVQPQMQQTVQEQPQMQPQQQAPVQPQTQVFEDVNALSQLVRPENMTAEAFERAKALMGSMTKLEGQIRLAQSLGINDVVAEKMYKEYLNELNGLLGNNISTKVLTGINTAADYVETHVAPVVNETISNTGSYFEDVFNGVLDAVQTIKDEVVVPVFNTAFDGTIATGKAVTKLAGDTVGRTGDFAEDQLATITRLFK